MKKKKLIGIFIVLMLILFLRTVSSGIYSDCEVYGNCAESPTTTTTTTVMNNYTGNLTNISQMEDTNINDASTNDDDVLAWDTTTDSWITKAINSIISFFTKTQVNEMIQGNRTELESEIASVNTTENIEALGFVVGGGGAGYNETYNASIIWAYNQTDSSTYNETYNASLIWAYNQTVLFVDTNVTSFCSGDEVLLGNGSCQTISGFGGDSQDGIWQNVSGVGTYDGNINISNLTMESKIEFSVSDIYVEVNSTTYQIWI